MNYKMIRLGSEREALEIEVEEMITELHYKGLEVTADDLWRFEIMGDQTLENSDELIRAYEEILKVGFLKLDSRAYQQAKLSACMYEDYRIDDPIERIKNLEWLVLFASKLIIDLRKDT